MSLCGDLIPKVDAAARDLLHKTLLQNASLYFKKLIPVWTRQRVEELAPHVLQGLADDDMWWQPAWRKCTPL